MLERRKGGQAIRELFMGNNVPVCVGIIGLISMFSQEDFKAGLRNWFTFRMSSEFCF